jgi:WD40 repeat protein
MGESIRCPKCDSQHVMFSTKRQVYICEDCEHTWQPGGQGASSTDPGGTRVFLSYAREDDKAFVQRLRDDLTVRGFQVWFDLVSMPSRQLTFHHEIRNAVTACDRLVLVVGPKAVASDYVSQEWQFGHYVANKCINPIVRLNGTNADGEVIDGYSLVPEELSKLHAEDFRDDAQYAAHLDNLVRQLSEPLPPVGTLVGVPELPPGFRAQPERLEVLRDLLLADLHRPVVVSGAAARVGVQGMGGIGKSVLANAVARHPEVRRAFKDGVFWIAIGQHPNVVELQRWLAKQFGDAALFDNEHAGKEKLRELLANLDVLLILDDVWHSPHAEAFNVIDPRSRILLTTRDAGLVTALAGQKNHLQVHLPSHAEAAALLASAAETAKLPPEAEDIINLCGRLPLALALCGGMVRGKVPWDDVLSALRDHDLQFLSTDHPSEEQHQSIWKAMDVSLRVLPEAERERFAELAVFALDTGAVDAAVVTLWQHTGGMSPRDARKLLSGFARRSLVQMTDLDRPGDGQTRRIVLHDLLHNFATGMAEKRFGSEAALHSVLLNAYQAHCPDGWATGPNDGYFLENLCRHMAEAERIDDLVVLLQDLAFLEAKVVAGLTFDLPRDFAEALHVVHPEHPEPKLLPLLDRAIRRDIYFIARHAEDYSQALFQCLWNSCWWYDCPEAVQHYEEPEGGWATQRPILQTILGRIRSLISSRDRSSNASLHVLMRRWRCEKDAADPGCHWLRALRPPAMHLGNAQKAVFRGHEGCVYSVAFSPDGARIVSGSGDNIVRVWDARSGEELQCLVGHSDLVWSVAISPDGTRVASGSWDGTARVWDAQSGVCVNTFRGHTSRVNSVAFSHDSTRVLSGSYDKSARVWDAQSGQETLCLKAGYGGVWSAVFSPDGTLIVDASYREMQVWNAQSGTKIHCLKQHTDWVESVAFSPDGARIVSGSKDNTVRVWDAQSGEEIHCLRGHSQDVWSVAFSPDGARIASGSTDDTVRVWDARSGEEECCLKGHSDGVWSVAFSPDGSSLVSGSFDKTVRVWDARRGHQTHLLMGHTDTISSVAFSPDGTCVSSSSNWDRTVRVWDAQSGQETHTLMWDAGHINSVAFSPDGTRIASGGGDRTVPIWDIRSGQQTHSLQGHVHHVWCVAFSSDGTRIASGSNHGVVRVWDVDSGASLYTLEGHEREVTRVTFSPDGTLIAGINDVGTVRVWDTISGATLHTHGQSCGVRTVAFSPDGTRIAGDRGCDVCVWDARSGQEMQCFKGHISSARMAFSPDGTRIASVSVNNKTVQVWDAATGECLEVVRGDGDVAAIAAGPAVNPFRALVRGGETVIEDASTGSPVAWFPAALGSVTTHPSESVWAGGVRNYLCLVRLEEN